MRGAVNGKGKWLLGETVTCDGATASMVVFLGGMNLESESSSARGTPSGTLPIEVIRPTQPLGLELVPGSRLSMEVDL